MCCLPGSRYRALVRLLAAAHCKVRRVQVDGDALAAPVPTYGRQCVLGAIGLVGVEVQAGTADDLARVRARNMGSPRQDVDHRSAVTSSGGNDGEAGEDLLPNRRSRPPTAPGGRARDDLHTVRAVAGGEGAPATARVCSTSRSTSTKPKCGGERERALVLHLHPEPGQAESRAVVGQRAQHLLADARATVLRTNPGGGEAPAGRLAAVRRARADHGAVLTGEEHQPARRVPRPELATVSQRSPGTTAIRTARQAS